jgi:hypothetical protein
MLILPFLVVMTLTIVRNRMIVLLMMVTQLVRKRGIWGKGKMRKHRK